MSAAAKSQARFGVNADNRAGMVSAQVGNQSDPRSEAYNIDPGENQYSRIDRRLSVSDDVGGAAVSASLETKSEFSDYSKGRCAGLRFWSRGSVQPPANAAISAIGVVQESIQMGLRIEQPGKVRLTASVTADVDIVEISFSGPSFIKPVKIYDAFDQTLDISKPGEYSLSGRYELAVRFPNPSLGGRELTVEMQASLTPA